MVLNPWLRHVAYTRARLPVGTPQPEVLKLASQTYIGRGEEGGARRKVRRVARKPRVHKTRRTVGMGYDFGGLEDPNIVAGARRRRTVKPKSKSHLRKRVL